MPGILLRGERTKPCRSGRLQPVRSSTPIAGILLQSIPWGGRPMESILPQEALIRPCRSGRPRRARLSMRIGGIPIQSMPWGGRPMRSISPLRGQIGRCKSWMPLAGNRSTLTAGMLGYKMWCLLSPGRPTGNVSPQEVPIRRYRSGMPPPESMPIPIGGTPAQSMQWSGHPMDSILPQEALIPP